MPGLPVQLLARALRPEGELDQAEALEAMYWIRHLLAAVAGVTCGLFALQGVVVLIAFVISCALISNMWCKYQDIDMDDFPESQPIGMEGFMPSVFLFLLCWVTTFSLVWGTSI